MWDSPHAHGCHASFTRLIHLEYTSIGSGHTVVTLTYVYIYICVLTTWLVTNMVDGVWGEWCNMGPQVWPQHWIGYESSVIHFIHRNIASNTNAHYSNHLNTVVLHRGSWMDDCDCMMAYSISICQYAINRPCYDKRVAKCQYVLLGGWWCATQSPTEHMVSLYTWGPF